MRGKGKISASGWLLLVITALFVLALLYLRASAPRSSTGTYEVAASRSVRSEAVNKVPLNSASEEELQQLRGIGPVLALRIVEYRGAHGPFTDVRQLLEIEGIGEKTLESIRDYVTLEVQDEDIGGG